jgi:hypothetical protein
MAAEKATEGGQNDGKNNFSKTMVEFTAHINAPLQKLDSASSEDAYNFYASYYKKIPQSQGEDRDRMTKKLNVDLSENVGVDQCENADLEVRENAEVDTPENAEVEPRENSELKKESKSKTQYLPRSEVASQPQVENISQNDLIENEYILYQMVNRVNHMPIVDNRSYIGKSTKSGHRFQKKPLTRQDFDNSQYNNMPHDQSIRVDSKIAPMNSKLRKIFDIIFVRNIERIDERNPNRNGLP